MAQGSVYAETDRLVLREMLLSDVDGMYALDSDPEVHKYLGNKPVQSKKESQEMILSIRQQYIDNGIGRWTMIEKATGDFVGWTGLKLIQKPANHHIDFYDVGFRLMKKHWGKGFATESAIASIRYGFEMLNLKEIIGIAHIENKNSRKALEKSGLIFIEKFTWPDWNNLECDWLKITREQWESKK